MKLRVRKELASIESSRLHEYSWGLRGAHSNIQVWQQENWALINYVLFTSMQQSVAESKWLNNQIPAIK